MAKIFRKSACDGPSILILKKIRRSAALSKIAFGWKLVEKDHQRVEGHLEFFTRLQREDIFVFFEWHNPAVDERLRRLGLAPKVVDDENAARGFQLQRGLIGPRGRVIDQIKHVERQFTAGNHGGPFAAHIAGVVTTRRAAQAVGIVDIVFGGGVHDRVIDGDNLTREFDGPRHIDLIAQRITIPFEIEDLPLPGGPYIKIERPAPTAGPRLPNKLGAK